MSLVFVYGTLKRGFHHHGKMGKAEYLGDASTVEQFPLVVDEYYCPYLLNMEGEGACIRGEVYSADQEVMARLDVLEGFPARYDRLRVRLQADDGWLNGQEAWVYVKRDVSKFHSHPRMAEYALDLHKAHYVPRELRSKAHESNAVPTPMPVTPRSRAKTYTHHRISFTHESNVVPTPMPVTPRRRATRRVATFTCAINVA